MPEEGKGAEVREQKPPLKNVHDAVESRPEMTLLLRPAIYNTDPALVHAILVQHHAAAATLRARTHHEPGPVGPFRQHLRSYSVVREVREDRRPAHVAGQCRVLGVDGELNLVGR